MTDLSKTSETPFPLFFIIGFVLHLSARIGLLFFMPILLTLLMDSEVHQDALSNLSRLVCNIDAKSRFSK